MWCSQPDYLFEHAADTYTDLAESERNGISNPAHTTSLARRHAPIHACMPTTSSNSTPPVELGYYATYETTHTRCLARKHSSTYVL